MDIWKKIADSQVREVENEPHLFWEKFIKRWEIANYQIYTIQYNEIYTREYPAYKLPISSFTSHNSIVPSTLKIHT